MPEQKHRPMLERLRNLTEREMADELSNERQKLFELRRQNTTRQLEDVAAIATTKKQIARLLTLQNERALTVSEE